MAQKLVLRLSLNLSLCLSLWLVLTLITACGGPPPAATNADAAASDSVGAACNPAQRKPGGGCCGPGTFFDADDQACVTVGPAACAAALPHAPRACVPRWCADWRDSKGAACDAKQDDCMPEGRACTPAEAAKGAGCPAGQWPQPDGQCAATGTVAALAPEGKLAPVYAGVDPPAALPVRADTSFCPDGADGALALCPAGTAAPGCKVGEMPDPDKAGACLAVGVPWTCPPGFVEQGGGCAPDPADCGEGPFGAIEAGPGVVFVDPAAPAGGDGSLAKPVQTLQKAATKLVAGSTLALAKGSYPGPISVPYPLAVRGRCAAMVTVSAPAGHAVVRVKGAKADGEVLIEGLTLTGASRGLVVDGALAGRGHRLFIHQTFAAGVVATGASASLTLQDSVVANTKPDGALQGYGAVVDTGASLALYNVRASTNRNHGIDATGAGTTLTLDHVWVDATSPGGAGQIDGIGVFMDNIAQLHGRSVRVSGNVGAGIRLRSGAGVGALTGLVVDGTKPDGLGENGMGVRLKDGPSLTLAGARLSGNRFIGVMAAGAAQLHGNGVVVDDTQASGGATFGVAGLQVGWGASASLRGIRLSGNGDNGLFVAEKASATVERLVVDGTRPRVAGGAFGYGISVQAGGTLTLRTARVTGAKGFGVRIADEGSKLVATNLTIDGVAVREKDGFLGYCAAVVNGATADVRGLRIQGCVDNAVLLIGHGVRGRICGLAAANIIPNPKAKAPVVFAIAALSGAHLQLAGAALPDQVGTGIYGAGPNGSLIQVAGLQYVGATSTPSPFAVGVQVDEGAAKVQVVGSQIRAARSVGIAVASAPTVLRDVVLLDTAAGDHQPLTENGDPAGPKVTLSDGIVVRGAAALAVHDAVVFGQARAGVFLDGPMTAQFKNALVGGGYFGEVFNGKPVVERKGVLLLNNTQNQSSDAGLPLPKPPKLVPLGEL